MSIDLVELGKDIGEAEATAEAALAVAEIAEVVAVASGEESHGCGEDCPCRVEGRKALDMLAALSDKYDEDMDLVVEILDMLLGEVQEDDHEEEQGEPEAVETIEAEEAESAESTGDKSSGEGNAAPGDSSEPAAAEEAPSEEKPKRSRRSAARARIGFRRGRR